ncbi:MAG TPA: hypothetical protein VK586_00520 [Streptosporangiaceae bacterium]|nr:hypothetical protein [Streptosporangiaceae bacterium]
MLQRQDALQSEADAARGWPCTGACGRSGSARVAILQIKSARQAES